MPEHEFRPRPARPLDDREEATLQRLERDLDRARARAERVVMRQFERDLERSDPAFATFLRAGAESPAMQSVASATIRAWIWVLSLLAAVGVGLGLAALVASTLGPPGLAIWAAILLTLFIGLVVTVRFS